MKELEAASCRYETGETDSVELRPAMLAKGSLRLGMF